MATTSILLAADQPSSGDIKFGIEGNICRCTGYQMIVEAVNWAAANGGPEVGAVDEEGYLVVKADDFEELRHLAD